MTDDSSDVEENETEQAEPLDETVAQFLRDVDSAHEDYDRGYVDADATLSVVMTHVEELRDAHENQ
ncbi:MULTISPECIES: hypothetical protein [Halobellus]|uniref:hypothetical protein n=1 Tax=Halobellus TaxID=1073986 RepID=UPI0021146EF5|nr:MULTISPECIES: hypothetical protein [Halobellus]MDQ2054090.1 hypothetical protein [Halobellus sp. H-GB7]